MAEARVLGRMTYAEYLALERTSEEKHEYVNGQVYSMAGGTPDHGRLAMNLGGLLRAALAGKPCAVFSSDVRVRIEATGRSTYPDLSVVCGRLARAGDDNDAITNPTVLVEVLSDTTEASDRGDKFAHYRRLPSLREYVLVSQTAERIEIFHRGDRGDWVLTEAGSGETIRLESIDVALAVDDVYHDPLRPISQ
jgi:Uma2 family endonuclease